MDVTAQQNGNFLGESTDSNRNDDSVGGVRKCWATARERNRMKARYAIQQRVFGARSVDATTPSDVLPVVHVNESNHCEEITRVLHRIIRGDTSYFSLQFMEEHFELLNKPFPSQFLWETNHGVISDNAKESVLLDTVRLRSRLGHQSVSELECYASDIDTCTIVEYAVWLKRYRIIRQLIIGGIDPVHCKSVIRPDEETTRAKDVGVRIQQLFLSGVIPLSLSCYVVTRVIGLRQSTWKHRQSIPDDSISPTDSVECMICGTICGATTDLLRYLSWSPSNSKENQCHLSHSFCEVCIWNDILKHLDRREGDVVKCPICHHSMNVCNTTTEGDEKDQIMALDSEWNETRLRLYTRSLANFNALPMDSAMIKKIASKKKTPSEHETICSTWSDAVQPFIGVTQTSRREKYFHFVEKGSYHHVKACIDQGIDLNVRNEYGQTAFFIAVWQHDIPLVGLLLYYGCNPSVVANGGISPYSVAKLYGYTNIVSLLEENESTKCPNDAPLSTLPVPCDESCAMVRSSPPSVATLIDTTVEHPGAGSFVVDDFLEDSFIDALFDLWKMLPEELLAKKKIGPCSERRYYCDAHRIISKTICDVLRKAITDETLPFQQVLCGTHMRFLNYSTSGAVLAPHIDLSRTDPTTTQRSTHSFLLYLSTCRLGGETALLGAVTGDGRNQHLATVTPKRGRILIFPHRCPHEGLVVVDTPKMLIRGELWIS